MLESYLLHPEKFNAIWEMLKRISKSDLLPDDFQAAKRGEEVAAANLLTPYTFACRMGMDLMQVCQAMHKINGKMTLSAQMIIAAINSSGKFIGPYYKFLEDKRSPGMPYACYCYGYRKSEPEHELVGSVISIDTAKIEGWVTKPGSKWATMRGQMLRYRAVTIWARAYCPEILMGFLHSAEEEAEGDKGYDMSQEIMTPMNCATADTNAPDIQVAPEVTDTESPSAMEAPPVAVVNDPPADNTVQADIEKTPTVETVQEDNSLPFDILDTWAEEFESENSDDYSAAEVVAPVEHHSYTPAPHMGRKKNNSGSTRGRRTRKIVANADSTVSTIAPEKVEQDVTSESNSADVNVQEAPQIHP